MIEPVSVHVVIPSPTEAVWPYVTVDELVGRWFADSTGLRRSGAFRFEFGDGDYFVGQVTEWQEARALGLTWRFMGVGPTFEIRIELAPCAIGTRVTVTDRGAVTVAEAQSLREGWTDFLMRLEKTISTGRVTRYEWSETISATALVGYDGAQLASLLTDKPWWNARFPGADVAVTRIAGGASIEVRDPAWRGASTSAHVTLERHEGMALLQIRHEGWAELPAEIRLSERRRFAGLWARTLAELETTAAN